MAKSHKGKSDDDIEKQKKHGTDTTGMTEEEKRAANRARVEQNRPAKETQRSQYGKDSEKGDDSPDSKANEQWAGGKSWKELAKENEEKGKGKSR